MKLLITSLLLPLALAAAQGCTADSDARSGPVSQQVSPPSSPTTPGNLGTLTDPTRNRLNQTGTSEQNSGSGLTPGATGNAPGQ